tara:strand:+ start:1838 stop:2623 length:786 start_codon:yes stop_codon:yes gene_type:complete
MSLTGKTKASTYKDLLQVNNSNNGVDTSVKNVASGDGTASAISISDDQMIIRPNNDDTTTAMLVRDKDGNSLLTVDSSNDLVKAGIGQHIANTQIKEFFMSSSSSNPDTADTWTALQSNSGALVADMEMGTGATPATTLSISSTASTTVQHLWYVPLNITIASCNVWFGATAASGDVVKFSVMSYAIDSSNGSTGGDLSGGTEVCVSPSTITGAGREQAYYQALTVSSADVNAGRVIMACVAQDGTNSDLTINMQLIYHLR